MLDDFVTHLNNCHPTIKFTADISDSQANFLDVQVNLSGDQLWTDLFCKPTDTHSYMRHESSHPHHIKQNLPYSEFLRLRRNCSRDSDFELRCDQFTKFFTRRGYPMTPIILARAKARDVTRESLLNPTPKNKTKNDTVKAITQFHPTDRVFKDTGTGTY